MKKFLVYLSLIYMTLFISCQKQEILSCDPEINEWAINNLSYYENALRDEIVTLPFPKQLAIYVGLSGEKKVSLWKDKFDIVASEDMLTKNQLIHYKKFIDFIEPKHFETSQGKVEFDEFASAWEEEMKTIYSCNDETLFLIAYTWMSKEEFNLSVAEYLTKSDIQTGPNNPVVCNCIYSLYCMTSIEGGTCQKGGCKQVDQGCGLMGNSTCNGRCE